MKLYQLIDSYGDNVGLIYTTVSTEVITQLWKEVYKQDEPEDSTFTDMLLEKLQERFPETDRLFIESEIEA